MLPNWFVHVAMPSRVLSELVSGCWFPKLLVVLQILFHNVFFFLPTDIFAFATFFAACFPVLAVVSCGWFRWTQAKKVVMCLRKVTTLHISALRWGVGDFGLKNALVLLLAGITNTTAGRGMTRAGKAEAPHVTDEQRGAACLLTAICRFSRIPKTDLTNHPIFLALDKAVVCHFDDDFAHFTADHVDQVKLKMKCKLQLRALLACCHTISHKNYGGINIASWTPVGRFQGVPQQQLWLDSTHCSVVEHVSQELRSH